MANVYIGLGTNLGDRNGNLCRARSLMNQRGLRIVRESSVLTTEPVEYLDQPDFLNQIVKVETVISPHEMLDLLIAIENEMGRVRDLPKGPRIIDLDILLYDNIAISDNRITLPHPGIATREFIQYHLRELGAI